MRVGAPHQHIGKHEQQYEHQRRFLLHRKQAGQQQAAAHQDKHHEGNREQVDKRKEQAEATVVVAVEDPLRNCQRIIAFTEAQKPPRQQQEGTENTQGPGEPVVQVGAQAVAIHKPRIDNKSRRGSDGGRQGDADQVGAHVLVADGKATNITRSAHTHPGEPEHQNHVGKGHGVLEKIGGHGRILIAYCYWQALDSDESHAAFQQALKNKLCYCPRH